MNTRTTMLLFMLLAIVSCKKKSNYDNNIKTVQKGISYPDSIYYGKNILSFPDSTVLFDGMDYEIGAVLEKDANLFVVITNYPVIDSTSGHITDWAYANATGWTVSDYNDTTNTQKFTSIQTGKIDSKIYFFARDTLQS